MCHKKINEVCIREANGQSAAIKDIFCNCYTRPPFDAYAHMLACMKAQRKMQVLDKVTSDVEAIKICKTCKRTLTALLNSFVLLLSEIQYFN